MRLLTIGCLLLIAAACGGGAGQDSAPPGSSSYPQAYTTLGLPELPDGSLLSTGRQTTSLRDGLSIRLNSARSVEDLREFYREGLLKLGWVEAPVPPGARAAGMPVANVAFTKDRLSYTALITRMPSETQVLITVLEKSE